jgi:hypothetical protein
MLGTELDRSMMRSLGGVLARGLIRRVESNGEAIPAQHALAIVVTAAAKVQAAHATGGRQYVTPDTVLIRYDGTVELRSTRFPQGSDPRADVRALGRLLVELLGNGEMSGDMAAALAGLIDHDRGPQSPEDMGRTLVQLARDNDLVLSAHELGRYARRTVYPRGADTPATGVAVQPDVALDGADVVGDDARFARGSAEFHHDELPRKGTELDFDQIMRNAVAADGANMLTDPRPRISRLPRASTPLPVASGTRTGRSVAIRLLQLLVVLMILGAAGFVLYAAYPEAVDSLLKR